MVVRLGAVQPYVHTQSIVLHNTTLKRCILSSALSSELNRAFRGYGILIAAQIVMIK